MMKILSIIPTQYIVISSGNPEKGDTHEMSSEMTLKIIRDMKSFWMNNKIGPVHFREEYR